VRILALALVVAQVVARSKRIFHRDFEHDPPARSSSETLFYSSGRIFAPHPAVSALEGPATCSVHK
jgi:hypothetical protein